MSEPEALLQHRHLTAASRHSALEDAWLLARLRSHGLSFEDLARRLCRSKSWVSRRLALLDAIAAAAQSVVRAGIVPPQAAMKYLVPLARANRGDCEQLIAGLGTTPVTVREVGALYQAWRRADATGRAQLVADPRLFLRALAAATTNDVVADPDAVLLKDLLAITGIAWRAQRRVHQGGGLTAAQINAWRPARDAFAALAAAIEEKHAGPIDPNHHPGAP